MLKVKTKYFINNSSKGSAYIYVLIIMLSIFIMLNVVISITSNEVLIVNAKYQNGNLYHMAKGGIDIGLNALNNVVIENIHSINHKILEDLHMQDLKEIVTFISEDNPFTGNFHITHNETLYKSLFEKHTNDYISDFLVETNGILNLDIENYSVDIFLNYNNIRGHYNVVSVATNTTTNISITLEAILTFNWIVDNQIISENYMWYDIPMHYENGMSEFVNFDEVYNTQSYLYENNWMHEYPILFNSNENLYIDIANFYYEDIATNSIIIHNGEGDLYIHTSEESKNMFNGIILSRGNIVFEEGDYIVEGNLISGGYINYKDLNFTPNSDILFYINFENKEHTRQLYDSLFLTNFTENNGYPLNRISICSKSPLEVRINQPILFEILYLNETN